MGWQASNLQPAASETAAPPIELHPNNPCMNFSMAVSAKDHALFNLSHKRSYCPSALNSYRDLNFFFTAIQMMKN